MRYSVTVTETSETFTQAHEGQFCQGINHKTIWVPQVYNNEYIHKMYWKRHQTPWCHTDRQTDSLIPFRDWPHRGRRDVCRWPCHSWHLCTSLGDAHRPLPAGGASPLGSPSCPRRLCMEPARSVGVKGVNQGRSTRHCQPGTVNQALSTSQSTRASQPGLVNQTLSTRHCQPASQPGPVNQALSTSQSTRHCQPARQPGTVNQAQSTRDSQSGSQPGTINQVQSTRPLVLQPVTVLSQPQLSNDCLVSTTAQHWLSYLNHRSTLTVLSQPQLSCHSLSLTSTKQSLSSFPPPPPRIFTTIQLSQSHSYPALQTHHPLLSTAGHHLTILSYPQPVTISPSSLIHNPVSACCHNN